MGMPWGMEVHTRQLEEEGGRGREGRGSGGGGSLSFSLVSMSSLYHSHASIIRITFFLSFLFHSLSLLFLLL